MWVELRGEDSHAVSRSIARGSMLLWSVTACRNRFAVLLLVHSTKLGCHESDVSCHFGESHSTRDCSRRVGGICSVGDMPTCAVRDTSANLKLEVKADDERAFDCSPPLQLPRDSFFLTSYDDFGRDD